MKAYSVIAVLSKGKATLSVVLVSMLALTGCGAGSTDNVQVPDYSGALNQAIKNYAYTMPKLDPSVGSSTLPAYTSAHVFAEGVDMGDIAGTSDVDVITRIANVIIADPAKYQPVYALLLSAEGMHFTVQSNRAYIATKYVAKLTPSGLVVVMV